MSTSELLTIGAFARACGLTASALRFYADSGLLRPSSVDQLTGYRYYERDQVDRAVVIRRLREIDMPLDQVGTVLAADSRAAARIIDDHVASLVSRAHQARETAAAIKATWDSAVAASFARVNGPVFTAAVEQVLTATAHEPGLPVLNGVHLEVTSDGLVLTATDRYRLSTRTLVTARQNETDWSATVDADDLRLAMPWTRRQHELRLSTRPGSVSLRGDDTTGRECRVLAGSFPDYRLLMSSLPEVRTRVLVARNSLMAMLEQHQDHQVGLRVSGDSVTVRQTTVRAVVTGPPVDVDFAATTVYPAISTAVGPDVMLDIAAPDQPVVVRSADNGDLTTLVMPIRPELPLTRERPTS